MVYRNNLAGHGGWLIISACLLLFFQATANFNPSTRVAAQESEEPLGPTPSLPLAEEDETATGTQDSPQSDKPEKLSLLWLLFKGGAIMIPIGFMSVFVVALVIERFISLRRAKVIPPGLVRELGNAADKTGGFDPREAYRICQRFPSATSNVIRSMLLKVGRPLQEVEHATIEASDREANRLYANVRWLNLAASVAPLIGLLGTVWGMIQAFFQTTQLEAGQNKADFLASGIYVALVTTLGGLAVAIPAAICAHYFEGRIHWLFHQIDELLFNLLPQVERYEGRLRVSRQSIAASERLTGELPLPEAASTPETSSTPAPSK